MIFFYAQPPTLTPPLTWILTPTLPLTATLPLTLTLAPILPLPLTRTLTWARTPPQERGGLLGTFSSGYPLPRTLALTSLPTLALPLALTLTLTLFPTLNPTLGQNGLGRPLGVNQPDLPPLTACVPPASSAPTGLLATSQSPAR